MDLNELLHAHQLAAMKARDAGSTGERDNQFDLITLYAERIRQLRKNEGAPEGGLSIVYGEAPRAQPA